MTEFSKAVDILDKMDFFHGQRAGRELWNDKPRAVQDKDVADFARDVKFLKDFINYQKAEIERLEKALHDWENCFHRMDSLYHIKCMELNVAKAEAYKEFAERLKDMSEATWWFDENEPTKAHVEHYVLQSDIDKLLKEMTGER